MKGGIFIFATSVSDTVPQNAPVPIAATTPVHIGKCQYVRNTPQITAVKVISVPTDKSIPPVMITNVLAIARTPSTAVACRMPRILSICMNAGEAILKKTSSRMRLAKARSFCRAVGPKSRARKPDGRPSLARASDRMVIVFVSRRFHGFALGRQLHDPLLRRVAGRQLARDASFAHHDDAIAHPKDFGQLRRDHDDGLALLS